MRRLVVLFALTACADLTGPPLNQRPAALIDCLEQPDYPDCQEPEPVPSVNITLSLLADIPLTIALFAQAPGADRITAISRFYYGPGWKDSAHSVAGSSISVSRALGDPLPLRVDWLVTAWTGNVSAGWVAVDYDTMQLNLR